MTILRPFKCNSHNPKSRLQVQQVQSYFKIIKLTSNTSFGAKIRIYSRATKKQIIPESAARAEVNFFFAIRLSREPEEETRAGAAIVREASCRAIVAR